MCWKQSGGQKLKQISKKSHQRLPNNRTWMCWKQSGGQKQKQKKQRPRKAAKQSICWKHMDVLEAIRRPKTKTNTQKKRPRKAAKQLMCWKHMDVLEALRRPKTKTNTNKKTAKKGCQTINVLEAHGCVGSNQAAKNKNKQQTTTKKGSKKTVHFPADSSNRWFWGFHVKSLFLEMGLGLDGC